MKIKITCRSRYNPWLKKYLNTKIFSKMLALGILINSVPISSFAGILSDDGRYETFEGSDITIPNILEEDKVDVEIEGNTMVNVANQKDPVPITKSYSVEGTNHIPLQGDYDGKARPVIEGNTIYYNNDTGEYSDTFIEGANLSLVSSFEDQLVTQEMIDSGLEKQENLGKYKVEIKTTGKNKLNPEWLPEILKTNSTKYGVSIKIKDNKIIQSGVATETYTELGINIIDYLIDGVKYVRENRISLGLQIVNHDNTFTYPLNEPFTVDKSTMKEIRLYYQIEKGKNYSYEHKIPQLEEGSIITEYEPYKESIKTFYLNSPLLEGDTIEDIDGKATHVKRYEKVLLDGSENWSYATSVEYPYFTVKVIDNLDKLATKDYVSEDTLVCNRYKPTTVYSDRSNIGITLIKRGAVTEGTVRIRNSYTDINLFKKDLKSNPVVFIYKLANPIYETISEKSILIDSYKDAHLDLNTNIPVNKVDFVPTTINLNYLYPSTEYTIQFESDNVGKIDTVSLGGETLYSNYTVNQGINRFNITTPSEISSTELILDGIGFNLSNLVVTEAVDESFDYFEGIKSVGQDDVSGHKIELLSSNKNLLNKENFRVDNSYIITNHSVGNDSLSITYNAYNGWMGFNYYGLDPNKTYTISYVPSGDLQESRIGWYQGTIFYQKRFNVTDTTCSITLSNIDSFSIKANTSLGGTATFSNIQIEEGSIITPYTPHQLNKIEVLLKEPLRSLPNGIKDRIIKRNGQWVVERNIEEIVLDGSEDWKVDKIHESTVSYILSFNNITDNEYSSKVIVSDKIISRLGSNLWTLDIEGCGVGAPHAKGIKLNLSKEKLTSLDVNGLKKWLQSNYIKVIYQLAEPRYESLNIDSTINTYLDTTHISTNSSIPANLKVTVDRTMNRATEAVELAKINPTTENLSLARMWTNLLRESIKKDELQSELNSNIDIVDLQLERKIASSNVDVYIKSENMLSMNLSTNSITFEDFSGVEDMVKENAVNISINSSLPYNLNAYLATDIQNSDKSNIMNKDILSIKDSSEVDYQTFTDTTNKVVLKSNCNSGNDKQHNINLKLNGGIAHEKDVYKTTIKFEAEQQ